MRFFRPRSNYFFRVGRSFTSLQPPDFFGEAMALSSALVLEVRTATGSDTNGGGFVEGSGGTDYSQQVAAQATGTVTSVTTTVTATTAIFTAAMVGNLITDGTTWKQITAFTSTTIITVDSAPSWTAATIKVGGALATLKKASLLTGLVAGTRIWCKGTEISMTGITASSVALCIMGYNTTRGDGGKYNLVAGAEIASLFACSQPSVIENIRFDGNGTSSFSNAISLSGGANRSGMARNIEVTGVEDAAGAAFSLTMPATGVWIHDNNIASAECMNIGTAGMAVSQLEIGNNPNAPYALATSASSLKIDNFLIYNMGAGGAVNISGTGGGMQLSRGVIYNCFGSAVQNNAATGALPGYDLDRVIIVGCSQALLMTNNATNLNKIRLHNVYEYNNTTPSTGNYEGTLTLLTGDPFTDAAAANFALSPTGANYSSLKQVGFTYPSGTTTDYSAAGAAAVAPGSGGGGGGGSLGTLLGLGL